MVRLIDRLDIDIAVDWDDKPQSKLKICLISRTMKPALEERKNDSLYDLNSIEKLGQ